MADLLDFYSFANAASIPTRALHRAVQERRIEHYDFGPEGTCSQDEWSQDCRASIRNAGRDN